MLFHKLLLHLYLLDRLRFYLNVLQSWKYIESLITEAVENLIARLDQNGRLHRRQKASEYIHLLVFVKNLLIFLD